MADFGSGYFCLHSESAGDLKSFSAASRSGTHIVKLEVQFGSAVEMGYAIEELNKLQVAIKAVRASAKKTRPRLIALPASEGSA